MLLDHVHNHPVAQNCLLFMIIRIVFDQRYTTWRVETQDRKHITDIAYMLPNVRETFTYVHRANN